MDDVGEIERSIQRLIQAVSEVGGADWAKSRHVAKIMEGSEEFAEYVSGLAQVPEAAGLFVVSRDGWYIKLTEKSLRRVVRSERYHSGSRKTVLHPSLDTDSLADTSSFRTTPGEIAQSVRIYASNLRRLRLRVMGISTVAKTDRRYVQAVGVTLDDGIIPSETPVELYKSGGGMIRGRVVGQEPDGTVLYVAFDNQVMTYDLPSTLSVDRAFLLHNLAESLDRLVSLPGLSGALFGGDGLGPTIGHRDSVEVADKLAELHPPWTRFLWGPPGAGKTYAIGRLIARLLQSDHSGPVLLVAPSNLAVDVALEQLLLHLEHVAFSELVGKGRILRYGYPRKHSILSRADLQGPPELRALTNEVKRFAAEIARVERAKGAEIELSVLRAELIAKQEEIRSLLIAHLAQCRVVATTAAMAFLKTSPIHEMKWSTVIIDEVTMVPPAVCVYLSSLATGRLLLAGDPRQLGPVYEQNRKTEDEQAYQYMGRDVFDLAGVSRGNGERRSVETKDRRLVRITSQRRCDAQIWQHVEHLYPDAISQIDGSGVENARALPPLPGIGVVVLDMNGDNGLSHCQKSHGSWENVATADTAIEVASAIIGEAGSLRNTPSIAIITPYRAQVRGLRQRLSEELRANSLMAQHVEAGTIHQFQGSEADVVIFDVVDGPGRARLGALLCGDTGYRLVTVALTRARGKCIILADRTWCADNVKREDNPLLWDVILGRSHAQPVIVTPAHQPLLGEGLPSQRVESPIEQILLDAMLDYAELSEVKTQHHIRDGDGRIVSRADFAFPGIKYAVYADGAAWHLKHGQWQRDLRQRNRLTELGWTFSVFSGTDIKHNPEGCAQQVLATWRSRRQQMR